MARPNQVTFVSGNVLTAAQMNGIDTDLSDVYDNYIFRKMARATTSGTQSIPNNTATAIAFPSEDLDTEGWHDNSTNNSRMTIDADGFYMVVIRALLDGVSGTGSGYYSLGAIIDGGAGSTNQFYFPHDTQDKSLEVVTVVNLTNGQYIEAYITQTCGSSANLLAATMFVMRVK